MAENIKRFEVMDASELDSTLQPSANYQRKHAGRFATTEHRQAFRDEVGEIAKKQKRLKTHNYGVDLISDATEPLSYAIKYFQRLLDGLKSEHISTHRFVLKHYEWAVPGPASTPEQLSTWEMLDRCAMAVPDTELRTVFRMEESTLQSPANPGGARIAYIRTFPITPSDLRLFLDRMISRGIWYEEFRAWDDVLAVYKDGHAPDRLSIRYAGETTGPKRAIDRQVEDEQREFGVMSAFLKAVAEFLPQVERECKIWTLVDACLPENSYRYIDDNERMTIQIFNPKTLLNRQRGGYYASYVPSSSDAATFRGMATDFWHKFNASAGLPTLKLQSALDYHFKSVQKYANDNPAETGTGKVGEYSDDWTKITQQQATPYQYRGLNVLVFIGKDVTREEYHAKGTFMGAKSRAGYLTRDFVRRLVQSEASVHRDEFSTGAFDPTKGAWCFVDLWSWPWHKNPAKALEFLQDYMTEVQPLIAAVYSAPVNTITSANFVHGNGVAMNSFIYIVGTPAIQYYSLSEDGLPRDDTAFISIPHIHPGKDKYGTQDVRLRRVLDLTMQLTFLVGDITLKYIDEMTAQASDPPSRLAICREIMLRLNTLYRTSPPHRAFSKALVSARNDLIAHWNSSPASGQVSIADFFDERPRMVPEGFVKISSLGRAEGPPGSLARSNQLANIWDQNMPDLHLNLPHDDFHQQDWFKALASAEEGTFYYLNVLAEARPDSYSINLFATFRTGRKLDKNWFQDPAARRRAVRDATDFIDKELLKLTDSGAIAPNLAAQGSLFAFLSPKDCHNRRVQVLGNGRVYIRFIHPEDGRYISIESLCKPAIPKDSSLRYLQFSEHGIDIVGAKGEVFRRELLLSQVTASIPLSHIQGNVDFVTLWQSGCEAQGIPISALQQAEDEANARDYGQAGIAPLNSQAREEKPKQRQPLQETDGLWLLEEFLKSQEHLRDGGIFRTQTVDRFPDSTEDLQAFVTFLKRPEYRKHPYQAYWLKNLDGDKPSAPGILGKNLPLLRNSVVESHGGKSANKSLRVMALDTHAGGVASRVAQVHENIYILGAPGSRLSEPFKKSGNQSCLSEKDRKANIALLKAGKSLDDIDDEEEEASKSTAKPSTKTKKVRKEKVDEEAPDADTLGTGTKRNTKRRSIKQTQAPSDDGDEPPLSKKTSKRRSIKQPTDLNDDDDIPQPSKKAKPTADMAEWWEAEKRKRSEDEPGVEAGPAEKKKMKKSAGGTAAPSLLSTPKSIKPQDPTHKPSSVGFGELAKDEDVDMDIDDEPVKKAPVRRRRNAM